MELIGSLLHRFSRHLCASTKKKWPCTCPVISPWLLMLSGLVCSGCCLLLLCSSKATGMSFSSSDGWSFSLPGVSSEGLSCRLVRRYLGLRLPPQPSANLKCLGEADFLPPLQYRGRGDSEFSLSSGDSHRPLIFNWSAVRKID